VVVMIEADVSGGRELYIKAPVHRRWLIMSDYVTLLIHIPKQGWSVY
jgi:hypothetical protein